MKHNWYRGLMLLGRSVFLILLFYLIAQEITFQFERPIDFQTFMYRGILTLVSFDMQGNPFFNFIKVLMILSVFFVGYCDSILCIGDLSEKANHILKFHSHSRYQYVKHYIQVVRSVHMADVVVWLVGLSSLMFYAVSLDIVLITVFLTVNLLACLIIALFSKHAMGAFIGFSGLFLAQQLLFSNVYTTIFVGIVLLGIGTTGLGSFLRGDES